MPAPHVMTQSRAIPVEVETAFHRTLVIPLPDLFRRWYGPIAPVKAVSGQEGEWGTVGQTRTVAPRDFGYTLSGIAGPLAHWSITSTGCGRSGRWVLARR